MVGHSSCVDNLPEVLWTGRALASEQRTRPSLSGDQRLELTGLMWVLELNNQVAVKISEGLQFL